MAEFKIAFQKTLAHEGGYVNDPDDLGAETYKGISRKSHNTWSGWVLIDQNKNNPNFPKSLEANEKLKNLVEQFYFTSFWKPLKADQIQNQSSADSIFDFAVNAGIKTASGFVQAIVGTQIDGIVGEKTLSKINSMDFGHFQTALTVTKLKFYLNIIRRRPTSKKFLLGWFSRSLSYNE